MMRFDIRRCRLTIAQMMTAIAACAVGRSSPKLLVIGSALIAWWVLILGLIYTLNGRRAAEWIAVAIIIVVLYALYQPAAVTRRRLGGPTAPPQPAQQWTRPAAAPVGRSDQVLGEPAR
jgi:hypothetical protein